MLLQLILVACLAVVGFANTTYKCPSRLSGQYNAKVYGKNCYEFETMIEKDFPDAQEYCQDNGGHLAFVKSQDVNNFLANSLENAYGIYSVPVWIGLQYNPYEKKYKWVDGTPLGNYNSIDNVVAEYGSYCVALYPKSKKWHEFKCETGFVEFASQSKLFVCEYPAIPITTTTLPPTTLSNKRTITVNDCPKIIVRDDYLQVYDGKCYMFETDILRTFDQADNECQRGGGRLATVNSNRVDTFIQHELYNTYGLRNYAAWIGLRYNPNDGTHYWLDGTPLKMENYRQSQHDLSKGCVAISAYDGKWLDKYCHSNNLPYVCEFEPTPTTTTIAPTTTLPKLITVNDCPKILVRDSYLQVFGNKCYEFETEMFKTFGEAEKHCKYGGGILATVNSTSVDQFIADEFYYTYDVQHEWAWIGLRYNPKASKHYWQDGTPLTYKNNRDSTFSLSKECVVISTYDRKWVEKGCDDQSFPYVCEYNPVSHPPKTTTTTPTPTTSTTTPMTTRTMTTAAYKTHTITRADCPFQVKDEKNLQVHGHMCYFFDLDNEVTFQTAESYCEQNGGTLALIKSTGINHFLQHHLYYTHKKQSAYYDEFWIGLRYRAEEPAGYYWVDGTPLDNEVHNFGSASRQKECVAISAYVGKWREEECHSTHLFSTKEKLGYICEFDTRNPSPTSTTPITTTTSSTVATTQMPNQGTTTVAPTTTTAAPTTTTAEPTTTTAEPTTTTAEPTTTTAAPTTTNAAPTTTTAKPTTTTAEPTTTTAAPTTTTAKPTTTTAKPTTTTAEPTTTTAAPTTTTAKPTTTTAKPTTTTAKPTTTTVEPTTTTAAPTTTTAKPTTTTAKPTTTTAKPTTTTAAPTTTTAKPTTTTAEPTTTTAEHTTTTAKPTTTTAEPTTTTAKPTTTTAESTTTTAAPTTTTAEPTTTTAEHTTTTAKPTTTTAESTTTTAELTTTTAKPTTTTAAPTTTTAEPTTTTAKPTATTVAPTTTTAKPTTTTAKPTTTTAEPTTTTAIPTTTTAAEPTTTTAAPTTTTAEPTTTPAAPTTTTAKPATTTAAPTTTTAAPITTTAAPTTTTAEPTTTPAAPTTTTAKPATTTAAPTTTTAAPTTSTAAPTTTTAAPTTSTTKTTTIKTQPPMRTTCATIICELDCGLDGYKQDPSTGCIICECDF